MEALAIWKGMKNISEIFNLGRTSSVIESDALEIINVLKGESEVQSEVKNIVEAIFELNLVWGERWISVIALEPSTQ